MTVTAPQGFQAAGVTAGLKASGGRDLAVVVNRGPHPAAAAVFTSNRAQANPVRWSRMVMGETVPTAIVLNSGGANCFTGEYGYETTRMTAAAVAEGVGTEIHQVLVCSTGLIGEQLDRDLLMGGVDAALTALSVTGGDDAADAILTTDTRAKTVTHTRDGWTIGAMAKGAGMLAPSLATMLVVITTDAWLSSAEADAALRAATRVTFDRLDSDGCQSTNDQVTLLASGATGIRPDREAFDEALTRVCAELAHELMADAEGAHHEITITVSGAASEDDAVEVARSVARNNLFKTAIFGNDANWGRVLAAIGTTRAEFDPDNVDVSLNGVRVCHRGEPDRPRSEVDLTPRAAALSIELNVGAASASVLTNDLTLAYVHENSAYSS